MGGARRGGKTLQVASSFITIDRIFVPDIATVVPCVAGFQKVKKTTILSGYMATWTKVATQTSDFSHTEATVDIFSNTTFSCIYSPLLFNNVGFAGCRVSGSVSRRPSICHQRGAKIHDSPHLNAMESDQISTTQTAIT